MSKGLEAFNRIKSYFHSKQLLTKEMTLNDLDSIEKELKALEIIKNKCVDCWAFISDISVTSEEESVYAFSQVDLTKKEVELLKEVLL